MRIQEFDRSALAAGEKGRMYLDIAALPGGEMLRMPLLWARGARPGKSFVVVAGVHGDEYPGPFALLRVFEDLNPAEMEGTFLAVPVLNIPALSAGSRESPVDHFDMARICPGSPDGTISQRIAHWFLDRVVKGTDLLMDLHSAGTQYTMPQMAGYYQLEGEAGRLCREAAWAFQPAVSWGTPINRGRTISEATRAGTPGIYAETPGGAEVREEDIAYYHRGVLNILRYLGIMPGPCSIDKPPIVLESEIDAWEAPIRVNQSGLFYGKVGVMEAVRAGQLLGVITDPLGTVLEEIRAPHDGRVMILRTRPVIHAGEMVITLV